MSTTTPEIIAALAYARQIAVLPHLAGITREHAADVICSPRLAEAASALGLSNSLELVEIMAGRKAGEYIDGFRLQAGMLSSPPAGKDAGAIMREIAYSQGKMLSHEGWGLPRGISPSDIDMAVDSAGYVLFVELWRGWGASGWLSHHLKGQRRLYLNIARASDKFAVVLARHSVLSDGVQIRTVADIQDADVRFRQGNSSARLNADEFRHLVRRWAENGAQALAWLDTIAASQREAAA